MTAGSGDEAATETTESFSIGDHVSMTVSTGFGRITGELCAVKQHWIVLGTEKHGEMWVAIPHIVAIWKEES